MMAMMPKRERMGTQSTRMENEKRKSRARIKSSSCCGQRQGQGETQGKAGRQAGRVRETVWQVCCECVSKEMEVQCSVRITSK